MFHRKLTIACILILVLSAGVGAYGAWDEADAAVTMDDLDGILADLERSIERAEANRSAHPDFLTDLQRYLTDLKAWRQAMGDGTEPAWGDYQMDNLQDGLVFWADFAPAQYDSRFGLVHSAVGSGELDLGPSTIERGGPGNGHVLYFGGDDKQAARLTVDWGSPRAFTIAMWFHAESWGAHRSGFSRLFTDSSDNLRFFLVESYSGYQPESIHVQFGDYQATTEAHSVQLDHWHHAALVWDGRQIQVFIDGRMQELRRYRGENDITQFPGELPVWVGNQEAGDRQFFGYLDDIIIWDRALSAGELRELIR